MYICTIMSLRVELDKELEKKFREEAMKKYGFSKGAIKKATEEALKEWAKNSHEYTISKKEAGEVVKLMRGLLKGVKGTSTELKHEASKIWAENTLKKVMKSRG